MHVRCRRFALVALLVAVSVSLGAQKKEEKKLSGAQKQEIQGLVKAIEATMAGQPAPADFTATLTTDYLKALEGKTYVPFTLIIEPGKVNIPSVAYYLRVVPKAASAPAAEAPAAGAKPVEKKEDESLYPFEDVVYADLKAAVPGQPLRLTRAFAVPAGDYDVYIGLKETNIGKDGKEKKADKGAPPLKATIIKQSVSVPDFWNNELTTSSVMLAEKVEPLTTAIPKDQQAEHPYSLGATEITPAPDSNFTKKDELSIIFLIYNPMIGADKKPNLAVEYSFHQKAGETEKYFNKTNPQEFNGTTLPPQFDIAAGHQLVAGQSVPLASFPEGSYRLEIKVTDKNANKTVTRNVPFSVAAAS